VFCNRLVASIFSLAMAFWRGEPLKNKAPLGTYIVISLSNVYASACQYEALKYVSFPVQMLGKSFKMMPVMVWGMVISKKSYGVSDWLIAAAVTGGVTEFLMTGQIDSESNAGSSVYGLGLLGCFLLLDGFTSTFQEKLFKEYKTTKYNQMLYVNLGSVAVSTITLVLTGGVGDALGFCAAHPEFVRDATALSAAAVTGQWFIYSQVKEFGALVFAATMNVRQVNSILLSYATYGHSITILQVGGLATVFAALFYKSYVGLSADNSEKTPLVPKLDDPQEVKTLKSKDQA
jgi:adenosine 3'-phospho 5'-phosphosulfate transporter B2